MSVLTQLLRFGPHSFAIVTPSNEFKLLELNSQASSKFISDQHTVGSSITPQDVEDAIDLSQIHSFDMKSEVCHHSPPRAVLELVVALRGPFTGRF